MPISCPDCSTANPDEARFCLNCGARLPVPATIDLEHLEPYPPQGHARQARGRARGPSDGGRAPRRHDAVLRRQGLDRDGRDPGPRGLGRDHERRVRAADRAGLPVRGHARAPDGRRDLRVLRRADRARGRPAARGLRPGSTSSRGSRAYQEQVAGRARPGSRRPRRHQHGPGRGRAGRLGPPPRVHGDGRRRERRGPHGADGRARHGADHRRDAPAGRARSSTSRRAARIEVKGKAEPVAGATASSAARRAATDAGVRACATRRWSGASASSSDPAAPSRRRSEAGADRLARRRGRSGQEPADRGDASRLGSAAPERPPRERRRHPPDLGDLAVRLLRHDAAVRAVPADGGGDRRDRGHRSARKSSATSSPRRSSPARRSGSNRTCACGGRCSACPSPGRSRSRGRRSATAIMELVPSSTRAFGPTSRGCWCSRTSTGATRRRWTS